MKCKFHKICIHYRKNSHTCNNGGGPYCGTYKEFKTIKLDKKDKELLSLMIEIFVRKGVKIVK